jgi:hypothetical protein
MKSIKFMLCFVLFFSAECICAEKAVPKPPLARDYSYDVLKLVQIEPWNFDTLNLLSNQALFDIYQYFRAIKPHVNDEAVYGKWFEKNRMLEAVMIQKNLIPQDTADFVRQEQEQKVMPHKARKIFDKLKALFNNADFNNPQWLKQTRQAIIDLNKIDRLTAYNYMLVFMQNGGANSSFLK